MFLFNILSIVLYTKTLSKQELHQQFELPNDWPYFRRATAYHFPIEPYKDGYLRNPHLVLTHPSLDNGKVRLITKLKSVTLDLLF